MKEKIASRTIWTTFSKDSRRERMKSEVLSLKHETLISEN
jgi:hypothetical protein